MTRQRFALSQYVEVLRPILSREGMRRYMNGDSLTLDPSDLRDLIDRAAITKLRADTCLTCDDSGEKTPGMLDCPDCSCAEERASFNAMLATTPGLTCLDRNEAWMLKLKLEGRA